MVGITIMPLLMLSRSLTHDFDNEHCTPSGYVDCLSGGLAGSGQ
jgi:hypothetical protein